jgi:hypothetical protein
MKMLAVMLCVIAMLAADIPGYAGIAEVVDSFESPLPHPRFGLDFDSSTGTLWGIENSFAPHNIMNFDLSGNLIQGFVGVTGGNSTGIAVDPNGQHIYYWQSRFLQQASYPDGALLGTTQFPNGYTVSVISIAYDPILNRVVLAKRNPPTVGAPAPGFDFVIPGAGVDFSIELDFKKVADLGLILGFVLTQDSYWLLGPTASNTRDQIVRIDRATGQLVDRFILPNSHGQTYRGLALDPSTGLFYTNFSDEGIRVIKRTPTEVVNDLVTFEPLASTFAFKPQPAGCPRGFAGIFSFQATLSNISEHSLSDLVVEVTTITDGNLLQNADGGPVGTGALLTVPHKGGLSDGALSPEEFVDVPFQICVRQRKSFRFVVDVLSAAD